ncbi:MAG TPA: hypothetical protein VFL83_03410 [Anaeromyxobacter sp.]|nr:hypothetical protein [Anaeromyxobacter sp.]
MPARSSAAFAELVRAHVQASLQTLAEDERARWVERRDELADELGVEWLAPRDRGSALVWRLTMGSLSELRSAFRDEPAWLKNRYEEGERRVLAAYVEAHVAVLLACADRSPP